MYIRDSSWALGKEFEKIFFVSVQCFLQKKHTFKKTNFSKKTTFFKKKTYNYKTTFSIKKTHKILDSIQLSFLCLSFTVFNYRCVYLSLRSTVVPLLCSTAFVFYCHVFKRLMFNSLVFM